MRLAYLTLFAFACSSKPASPRPPDRELSTALAPLAWWLGDWQVESGATGTEHWIASSGVIFGIALQDDGFEVMIVDDGEGGGKADGTLRFWAMPGGAKQTEFAFDAKGAKSATFVAPQNDFPKSLTYAREGEALTATIAGDGKEQRFRYRPIAAPRAQALEDADLAFAKDVGARGIDAWVAAFDVQGGMMTKAGRVEGADAIRETMKDLLASTKIAWAPIRSAARGDIGYTVGKARFTGPEASWNSTYVTIWKKQPDGSSWKVLFDTGRTVQAE